MAPWILKETLNENYNLVSMLLKEVNNITSVETYELNEIIHAIFYDERNRYISFALTSKIWSSFAYKKYYGTFLQHCSAHGFY